MDDVFTSELFSFFFFFSRGPRSSSFSCSCSGTGSSPCRRLCPLLGLSTIDLTLPPPAPLSCEPTNADTIGEMVEQKEERLFDGGPFSCAADDDDDEQLLAVLGDLR